MHRRETHAAEDFGPVAAVLRALVIIGSIGFVALYAALVCLRVRYPFELEWLEGASVDHVRTILAGRPLYARPSLDFIPLTYTPGYFYLAAALSKLIGVGFLPLRLISIASSAGLLAVTARLAWRETGSALAGILAIGLFAALFGWTDGWLDLARTDSLFLLLTMLAVYILRWHSSATAMIAAGVLISLSFLTKQTGLIVAVPLALYCATRGWRPFVAFTTTVLAIVVGTTVLFNRLFDGWYLYYLYAVPRQHPVALQSVIGFWRYDLAGPLPIALVGAGAYLLWRLRSPDRQMPLFYLLVASGFFGGAWLSRLHSLSFINVVLPAYLATALVFGIAVSNTLREVATHLTSVAGRRVAIATYGLCLLQLMRVAYSPVSFVPTAQDVAAGLHLIDSIKSAPGRVFVPYHGYLPALAGRDTFAHAVVIADVIRGGTTDVERGLADQLATALRTHQFDSIIAIESPTSVRDWLPIDTFYRPRERVVSVQSRFWRPEMLYVPRELPGPQ